MKNQHLRLALLMSVNIKPFFYLYSFTVSFHVFSKLLAIVGVKAGSDCGAAVILEVIQLDN